MDTSRDTRPADTEGRIQAALNSQNEMRLSRRNGKFLLAMPALGLMVSNASLQAAYDEMAALRERRLREFAAEGLLHLLEDQVQANCAHQEPSLLSKLKPFLIKCAIATVLFLGASTVVSGGLRDVGYTLEKKLKSLALLSPEDVEKNRAIAENIAKNASPIVRELLVMFRQDAPGVEKAPPKQPAQEAAGQ